MEKGARRVACLKHRIQRFFEALHEFYSSQCRRRRNAAVVARIFLGRWVFAQARPLKKCTQCTVHR